MGTVAEGAPVTHAASASEVLRLQALVSALQERVAGRTLDHDAGRRAEAFGLLGSGRDAILRGLAALEPLVKTTLRNMQVHLRFEADDPYGGLNAQSLQRGITFELVVAPAALRSNPLLTSGSPFARIAPVFMPLLFIDQSLIVIGGARNALGEATAWVTGEAELLRLANALWDETYAVSVPALPDGQPPLSTRQLQTAHLVAQGATDERICRELHVSPRTVAGDIRAICALVGAGNRTEMVSRLMPHTY
jgi:DNA-binding CsgD family transcriptional regulator